MVQCSGEQNTRCATQIMSSEHSGHKGHKGQYHDNSCEHREQLRHCGQWTQCRQWTGQQLKLLQLN